MLLEQVAVHLNNRRFRPLAREEQRFQLLQAPAFARSVEEFILWIISTDGSQSCGSSKQNVDLVLFNHSPERASIWSSHGLSFEEYRCGAS